MSNSQQPEVRQGRKISKVWIIPILGLLLGGWLVKRQLDDMGEIVLVTFDNAEGLEANKTEVRCRSVKIGKVESIELSGDDLKVEVRMRINSSHLRLIRDGAQFWVVRPRVSASAISGLGTILSGSYIELDPGPGGEEKLSFIGEEQPPLTPASVAGLRLELDAVSPGSVAVGSGVYFLGNPVGRVERRSFDPILRLTTFGIFIDEEYAQLVNSETRFWRDNGIELEVGTQGFNLELPSLDSLISGRINFGTPENINEGEPLEVESASFPLFASLDEANASAFESAADFLLLLERSVRGLNPGAPVEFRGLTVGRVSEISYQLVENTSVQKTPVLIQLNEYLLQKHFPASFRDEGAKGLQAALERGLRASVKSSNIITGQMFIDLDYYPDLPGTKLTLVNEYVVLPTIETGFERLEDQVAALLEKLNNLEIETLLAKAGNTADSATETLSEIQRTLVAQDTVVGDARTTLQEITKAVRAFKDIAEANDTKALSSDLRATLAQLNASLKPLSNEGVVYGDLRRTLDEIRSMSRSMERMTTEIADKPNSLLFGKDPNSRKIPRARRKR